MLTLLFLGLLCIATNGCFAYVTYPPIGGSHHFDWVLCLIVPIPTWERVCSNLIRLSDKLGAYGRTVCLVHAEQKVNRCFVACSILV